MKLIEIHPTSLLAGAALGVFVLLAVGAFQVPAGLAVQAGASLPVTIVSPLEVKGIPTPQQMVHITDAPYTVPPGKLFVLTALGAAAGGNAPQLYVNGVVEITINSSNQFTTVVPSVVPVALGFTVEEGSIITMTSGAPGFGRAWGYLVDA